MFSKKELKDAKAESEKRRIDFYIPGEGDYENVVFWPISQDDLTPRKLLPEWASWKFPVKVKGKIGDDKALEPYRPWRRRAKEKIYEKLKVVPEQVAVHKGVEKELEEVPQPPMYFFDGVPNFSEVPLFSANLNFGQVETERGWWGELIPAISQTGVNILEAEKSRYESQIRAYQEAIKKREEPTKPVANSKTFIYLLLGGGVLYLLLKRKEA